MVMSFENLWTIKFFKFIQLSDKPFLNIITRTCLGSCLVGLYFVLFYYLFTFYWILLKSFFARDIWDKVLKNGPSQTCGVQPLKNLNCYDLPYQTISIQIFQRLYFTNFTWSGREYLFHVLVHMRPQSKTTYGSDKLVHCTS